MYYAFVMLKPDAIERNIVPDILRRLIEHDLKIELFSCVLVSEDLIFKHYTDKIIKEGFIFKDKLRNAFVGKYVIPIIISSEKDHNIISTVRKLIGDTDPSEAEAGTIRGNFANDSMKNSKSENRCCSNIIHSSDTKESYLFETELWFSKEVVYNFRY